MRKKIERANILVIAPSWPSAEMPYSGIFIKRLCDKLALKSDLTVVAPRKQGRRTLEGHAQNKNRNGYVVKKPTRNSYGAIGPAGFNTFRLTCKSFSESVSSALVEPRPDYSGVYGHFLFPAGFSAAQLSGSGKYRKTPIVVGMGESNIFRYENYLTVSYIKRILSNIDSFIFPSRYAIEKFHARYDVPRGKLYFVPNAVDDMFLEKTPKGECCQFLENIYDKNCIKILYVGTNHERKGLNTVLEVARKKRREPFHFILVGPETEKYKSGNITGLGVLPGSDIKSLYSCSDALLIPTKAEGFSNIILEAAALGVPVITTALGQHREFFGDFYPLMCEDPEDASCFSQKLDCLKDAEYVLPKVISYGERADEIMSIIQKSE